MRTKKHGGGEELAAIYASSKPHSAPDSPMFPLVPIPPPMPPGPPTASRELRVDVPTEHERSSTEISALLTIAGTRAKHYLVAAQQAEDEADRSERLGELQRVGSTVGRGALRNRFHIQSAQASRRKRDKLVAQARAIIQADTYAVHVR